VAVVVVFCGDADVGTAVGVWVLELPRQKLENKPIVNTVVNSSVIFL